MLVASDHPTRRTVTVVERDGADPTTLVEPAALDCWLAAPRSGRRRPRRRRRPGRQRQRARRRTGRRPGRPRRRPGDAAPARSSSTPTARGCSRRSRGGATVVKPNAHELAATTGDDDPVRAARALASVLRDDRGGLPGRGRRGRRLRRPASGWPGPRRSWPATPRGPGTHWWPAWRAACCATRTRPGHPERLLHDAVALRRPPCSPPRPATSTPPITRRSFAGVVVRTSGRCA